MTQMQAARQGIITEEMRLVARDEGVDVEWLQEQIAKGRVVIPRNINHPNYYPIGIGEACGRRSTPTSALRQTMWTWTRSC